MVVQPSLTEVCEQSFRVDASDDDEREGFTPLRRAGVSIVSMGRTLDGRVFPLGSRLQAIFKTCLTTPKKYTEGDGT